MLSRYTKTISGVTAWKKKLKLQKKPLAGAMMDIKLYQFV